MTFKAALSALAALVLMASLASEACAQGALVDTQMEVTTALVQSSLTIDAIKRADDAKGRELQARIDALSAEVKAGKAQKADLVAAKEALVARLSDTDAAYRAEIDAFRGAVTDIAATPEGLAALARFNAGDQVGALAILDKLQAAQEVAEQRATDIQRAAGERRIAELAEDAANKGKVTLAAVLARYESVVSLDPGVTGDWVALATGYLAEDRYADAERAAQQAVSVARDEDDRVAAALILGAVQGTARGLPRDALTNPDLIAMLGELASKALEERRALPPLTPMTADRYHRAAIDLNFAWAGGLALNGDRAVAMQVVQAWADLEAQLSVAAPDDVSDLTQHGSSLVSLGFTELGSDRDKAERDFTVGLSIMRRLAAADPTPDIQRLVSYALSGLGEARWRRGDAAGARAAFDESLGIARRLPADDPSARCAVGVAMAGLARLGVANVRWSDVAAQLGAVDAEGLLTPLFGGYLDEARANAAKEAAQ